MTSWNRCSAYECHGSYSPAASLRFRPCPAWAVLKDAGCTLSIETNGTVEVDPIIDWICVSPKDQMYPDVKIRQTEGDELKVVFVGQDLAMYDDLKSGFNHLFSNLATSTRTPSKENGRRSPQWRPS